MYENGTKKPDKERSCSRMDSNGQTLGVGARYPTGFHAERHSCVKLKAADAAFAASFLQRFVAAGMRSRSSSSAGHLALLEERNEELRRCGLDAEAAADPH